MVVIKGLFFSNVFSTIDDHWKCYKWHHFRTTASDRNCCCTKHYEEVEKRNEEEKIYSNFLFQHFFVLASRWWGGGELKYFPTHTLYSPLFSPDTHSIFFPFNRCCCWNGIHWRWEWIEEQGTLMGESWNPPLMCERAEGEKGRRLYVIFSSVE